MNRYAKSIENYMKEKDYIVMPINWMPTHFYNISFEGWSPFTIDADDETFQELMSMTASSLDAFISIYKSKRVFSEPFFSIHENGKTTCRIGTLDKEEYERRLVTPLMGER